MQYTNKLRYYRLRTADAQVPELILIAEESEKRLAIWGEWGNKFDSILMGPDTCLHVHNIVAKGSNPLEGNNLYAQIGVDPTGEATLRQTRFSPATIEELSAEEAKPYKNGRKNGC
jgi:hypothetical protein